MWLRSLEDVALNVDVRHDHAQLRLHSTPTLQEGCVVTFLADDSSSRAHCLPTKHAGGVDLNRLHHRVEEEFNESYGRSLWQQST